MSPPVTAIRPPKLRGEFWDVQPYRFMNELVDRYTQSVMQATQRTGQTIAQEATEWMQANAPWQDRTGDARAGLHARVLKGERDSAIREDIQAQAMNRDAELLDERKRVVRGRREAAERDVRDLKTFVPARRQRNRKTGEIRVIPEKYVDSPASLKLTEAIKTQRRYRMPKSLPKSASNVSRVEQRYRGQVPLVEVQFRHNPDLDYPLWLEIAHQGRYAIISRAVAHFAPRLFAQIEQIARLKQFRDKINLGPERLSAQQEFWNYVDKRRATDKPNYQIYSPRVRREKAARQARYQEDRDMLKQRRLDKQAYQSWEPVGRGAARNDEYSGPTLRMSANRTKRR